MLKDELKLIGDRHVGWCLEGLEKLWNGEMPPFAKQLVKYHLRKCVEDVSNVYNSILTGEVDNGNGQK